MSRDSLKNSEFLTRKRLIDGRLKKSGWKVVRYKEGRSTVEYVAEVASRYGFSAIEEYPTQNGPADYALCGGGKVLAIVEAKKLTLGPQNVLTQAERYARGLTGQPSNFRGYGVPFLYSTTGQVIWFHDIRNELYRSRQIAHFHTPDALAELLQRDLHASLQKLMDTPNDHPLIRPYQKDANEETEKAIAGIHPERIPAMLELLQDIALDAGHPIDESNPLRQVIVNTHSPSVVLEVPDDTLLVAGIREDLHEGHSLRKAVFGYLPDTWRAKSGDPQQLVSKGKLISYLNPVSLRESILEPFLARIGEKTLSHKRAKRRRVADREDLQQWLPLSRTG